MNIRKYRYQKILAIVLVASMITGNTASIMDLHGEVFSNESHYCGETEFDSYENETIYEATKDTTTFVREDGTKELVYHGGDVRYVDENGDLAEYDQSLVPITSDNSLDGYLYENHDGDMKQYFPEKLSEDTPLLMTNEVYQIAFHPIQQKEENVTVTEEEATEEFQFADTEKSVVETIYEDKTVIEDTTLYTLEEKAVTLKYTSLTNGIKETIELHEKNVENCFTFQMSLPGMYPVQNKETNEIFIYDKETDDIVAVVDAPFMNDSTNEAYSEAIDCVIESAEEKDVYILRMEADKAYLEDDARVYPVQIDPTVTWKGSSKVKDTYVINTAPYRDINFFDDGVTSMAVGNGKQGLFRSYMNFSDMKSALENCYVDSATLTLYETGISSSKQKVAVHNVTGKWNPSTITWNNRAGYQQTELDSFTTKGIKGTAHVIDLTSYARSIANGSNVSYGIMMRAVSEATESFVQFYGSRYSDASHRPRLSIVYYDGPTKAKSVVVPNNYPSQKEDIRIAWSGITSKALSHVEYRVAFYDDEKKEVRASYIPYSSSTKLGTTSDGSKTITGSREWKEGCYVIYVRGVDKGGIVGIGKGTVVHIDKTMPKKAAVSITPYTTKEHSATSDRPKISWSGAKDNHLACVEYQINDGPFISLGAKESGSHTINSEKIAESGSYKIVIRTVDKAGNTTLSAPAYYWYQKPEQPTTANKVTLSNSYMKEGDELTISWQGIASATLDFVQYRVVLFDDETKELSETSIIPYSMETKLGDKQDGSCKIDTSSLKSGCYRIYVRGVDVTGLTGVGKGATIHVDNDKPQLEAEIVQKEVPNKKNQKEVQIIWKANDTHFAHVAYSINGSEFQVASEEKSGSFVLPLESIQASNNRITFRAVDRCGNAESVDFVLALEMNNGRCPIWKVLFGFTALKWFINKIFY